MPPPRVVNQLMEGRRIIGSNININLLKTPAVILDIADSEEDEQRERDIREAGFKIRADAGGPESLSFAQTQLRFAPMTEVRLHVATLQEARQAMSTVHKYHENGVKVDLLVAIEVTMARIVDLQDLSLELKHLCATLSVLIRDHNQIFLIRSIGVLSGLYPSVYIDCTSATMFGYRLRMDRPQTDGSRPGLSQRLGTCIKHVRRKFPQRYDGNPTEPVLVGFYLLLPEHQRRINYGEDVVSSFMGTKQLCDAIFSNADDPNFSTLQGLRFFMAAYPILQLKLCVDKSRDINPSREHWPEMEQLTDNLLKLLHNKRMEVEIFQERKLTSILGASLLNDYISCGDDPARKVPYVPGSGTISILSKVTKRSLDENTDICQYLTDANKENYLRESAYSPLDYGLVSTWNMKHEMQRTNVQRLHWQVRNGWESLLEWVGPRPWAAPQFGIGQLIKIYPRNAKELMRQVGWCYVVDSSVKGREDIIINILIHSEVIQTYPGLLRHLV